MCKGESISQREEEQALYFGKHGRHGNDTEWGGLPLLWPRRLACVSARGCGDESTGVACYARMVMIII
jgi:hypothetical protein